MPVLERIATKTPLQPPTLYSSVIFACIFFLIGGSLIFLGISDTEIELPTSISVFGMHITIRHPHILSLWFWLGPVLLANLLFIYWVYIQRNSRWRIRKDLLLDRHQFFFSTDQPTNNPQLPVADITALVYELFPNIPFRRVSISEPYPIDVTINGKQQTDKHQAFFCYVGVNRLRHDIYFEGLALGFFVIGLNLVGLFLHLSNAPPPNKEVGLSLNEQSIFAANQDALWEEAIRTSPCPHIERVPIVAKGGGVSVKSAALSSVIGYLNLDFPILGPPPPNRLLRLVAHAESLVSHAESELDGKHGRESQDKGFQNLLYSRLHDLENEAFQEFLHYARGRSYEAEGLIRAHALQESYNEKPQAALQRLALSKAQVPKVRTVRPSREAIVEMVRSKTIGILAINADTATYPVLGGLRDGEYFTVIDPEEAQFIEKPAAEVLLTPQDLQSKGEFATKARAQLQGKILKMENLVPCTGSRPLGIRFIRMDAVPTTAELSVVDGWELDISRLLITAPRKNRLND